jgi:hypothetical protein
MQAKPGRCRRYLGSPAPPFKGRVQSAHPLGKPGDPLHIGDMTKTPEKLSTAPAAEAPATDAEAAKPAPDAGTPDTATSETDAKKAPKEIGGREGPDPTRYGDWEKAGRCVDF